MDELFEISVAIKEALKIKTDIPQSSFELWFGDFNLTSLTDSKAVFSTPTKLRRNILSTRYIDVIKESLNEVIGFDVEIEIFSLDSDSSFPNVSTAPVENMDKYFEKESLEEASVRKRKLRKFSTLRRTRELCLTNTPSITS